MARIPTRLPTHWLAALLGLALLWPPLGVTLPAHGAAPRVTSVRDGAWSDPAVWSPRGVPRAGAAVTIRRGTTVVYDLASAPEALSLAVEGTLAFSRERSTRLDVGSVIVRAGGVLEMGTARRPIPAAVSAEIRLVVPPEAVFKGGGFVEGDVGLWVLAGGRWEAHGTPLRQSWATLARHAAAGSSVVSVREDLTDWPAGAEVLVTPTVAAPADADFEEQRLVGVRRTAEGLFELHLGAPLARTHEGGAEFAGEVALLTRNVRISSKYPDRTRAHTVYMEGAKGGLEYAEFRDLGTFGVLGRYPVHFHQMGNSSRGMVVRGVSIWRSGNHFVNVHSSNGITIEDVVGYDAPGSGFFIENSSGDRSEVGEGPHERGEREQRTPASSAPGRQPQDKRRQQREGERPRKRAAPPENVDVAFIHTLAAKGVWRSGSLDRPNVALFWLTSLNVILMDNVAVGARGGKNNAGFRLGHLTHPDPAGAAFVMARNEARGNDDHGFLAWLNSGQVFDLVEFRARRNGRTGMSLGAYDPEYRVFGAVLTDHGEANVSVWMARAHLQDVTLSDAPVGLFFNRHFLPGDPDDPARIVNARFARHATADVSQEHRSCPSAGEEQSAYSRRCPPHYALFVRPAFESRRAIDFGWHVNAYSWFEILNPQRPLPGTPAQFRLSRRDREGEGSLHALFDGRVRPVQRSLDGPPSIEVGVVPGAGGRSALLRARAADDRGVAAVEIFVNGRLLRRLTAAPFEAALPAEAAEQTRLYVHARATDTAGNVSYSRVLRLPAPLR